MTIHDLNHASRFSDYLLGMKNGELIFQGTPKEIFTAEKLLNLFDIQATFATMPNSDKPLVLAYDLVKEH